MLSSPNPSPTFQFLSKLCLQFVDNHHRHPERFVICLLLFFVPSDKSFRITLLISVHISMGSRSTVALSGVQF